MDLQSLAVDIIARHGKKDVDWLTFSETIYSEVEDGGLELSDDEVEKLTKELSKLVNSAKVVIRWEGDSEEYPI